MQPIKFTINGNTPSKKTGQKLLTGFLSVFKNKKMLAVLLSCGVPQGVISKLSYRATFPRIKPGGKYDEWVEANPLTGVPCVSADDLPVYCAIKFFRKSKHKFDFINVAQSVMDLLVDRAVIPDDNADVVTPVFDGYEYDKDNPRCEVVIYN